MPHHREPRSTREGWDDIAGFALIGAVLAFAAILLHAIGLT